MPLPSTRGYINTVTTCHLPIRSGQSTFPTSIRPTFQRSPTSRWPLGTFLKSTPNLVSSFSKSVSNSVSFLEVYIKLGELSWSLYRPWWDLFGRSYRTRWAFSNYITLSELSQNLYFTEFGEIVLEVYTKLGEFANIISFISHYICILLFNYLSISASAFCWLLCGAIQTDVIIVIVLQYTEIITKIK